MSIQYLRKRDLSLRYRVTERSIDNMVADGRLPPPTLYNSRFPLWSESELNEHDRAATVERPRPAANKLPTAI